MPTATVVERLSIFEQIQQFGGELQVSGLDKEQFQSLTQNHPELRMERDTNGNITIMSPIHGGSGMRENKLQTYVTIWQIQNENGMVFSPSTGFDLPDGSIKSPDVAWLSADTLAQLSPQKIEQAFVPAVPDFVVELRSGSDRLPKLQHKMQQVWIANGVRLAWLIDPYEEKAYIYRADGSISVTGFEEKLSGEEVLPGFALDLSEFRLLDKQ